VAPHHDMAHCPSMPPARHRSCCAMTWPDLVQRLASMLRTAVFGSLPDTGALIQGVLLVGSRRGDGVAQLPARRPDLAHSIQRVAHVALIKFVAMKPWGISPVK